MTDESCTQPEGAGPQYERSESRPKLARHLVACTPCSADLDAMAAEREVLGYLGKRRQEGGQHGLVERVLAASAEEGRHQLASLLYELTRACVAFSPDSGAGRSSIFRLVEAPRDNRAVAKDFELVESRLASIGEEAVTPPAVDSGGFAAAARCLDVMETLEGETARYKVARGVVCSGLGLDSDALSMFEAAERMLDDESKRIYVEQNILATLVRLGRHAQAIDRCNRLLEREPHDRFSLFHMAFAYAAQGDTGGFDVAAERFAGIGSPEPDPEWWESFIDENAAWLSMKTNRSVADVKTVFRVTGTAEGRG